MINRFSVVFSEEFLQKVISLDENDKSSNPNPFFNVDFTQEDFTYLYENDKVSVKLLFNKFSFTMKNELIGYDGLLMIGEK